MLIAYLTTDELNQHLALQMAEECGETLCPLWLSDAPPDGEFDAVVYDWDYLPAQRQQAILAALLASRAPHPVAVHGYNVDEDCVEALRGQSVAVYRRLQPEVFRSLALAYSQPRATKASGCDENNDQDFEDLTPSIA
jgi:hypothetical protein